MDNKRLDLLGHVSVPRALLAMGLPTMLGMMINALYNLADACFVAGLGQSQLGAISVAYPLGQMIIGLGLLFGSGAASYVSRLLGSGQQETADKVAATALYSSIFVGIPIILMVLFNLRPLLVRLGASETVLPYAAAYTGIYIAGSIFNIHNVTMNHLISSEGAARTTMLILLSGAVLNIILDPVFIYTWKLGISGAALATVFSQFVSALLYLICVRSGKSRFHFSVKLICFTPEIMHEILRIGIPTLIFQLLTSLSVALINNQARVYGDSIVAAMGPVIRVTSVGSLMVFGFLKGFQPIAGYSWGARNFKRLCQTIRTAIKWSTVFCAVTGFAGALSAHLIMSGFSGGDPEMLAAGTRALRAGCIAFLPFGFHTVYAFLFLAVGKAREGLFLSCCRQGLCFMPLILFLPQVWGLNGVLYAQPVADIIAAFVTVPLALRLRHQIRAEEQADCTSA